jgi:ribosomal protein S18 acetylase RimI-like enzyme
LKLIVRTSQFADGFYKKQGFKEVNRIKDYWAKGYDMVLMEYQGV